MAGPPTRWGEWAVVVALLAAHATVLTHLAWDDSDTIDEPGHLVAALAATRQGSFRVYSVNPPLSRYIQGAFLVGMPLDISMIVEPERFGDRNELGIGGLFIDAYPKEYRGILFRARLGSVLLSLVAGVLVWVWADSAFGKPCGLVGLAVWCCDPMALAQGHLATPDMAGAVTALAAALMLTRYLVAPSWWRASGVGVTLGLALLAKFTLVLLAPIWLLIWVGASGRAGVSIRQGLFAAVVSLFVVNAGYLFQDTGRRLEQFRFQSTKLARFTPETIESLSGPTNSLGGTWLGLLPVPLPSAYLEGIDLQARDFDRYAQQGKSFFMAGRWEKGGRYWYYLYGLLVKEALALFGLLAVAAFTFYRRPLRRVDLLLLIAVPLAVLLLVSSQKAMNKHIRYVLPMLPFLAVLAGAAGRVWQREGRWPRLVVGLLMGWILLAGVAASRDPIAYFNEAAGGPRGGIRHLAGSNVDWGQGRFRLRDWLTTHPEFRPVGVACYGTGANVFAGMELTLPPSGPGDGGIPTDLEEQRKLGPHPGRFAVSARVLQGDSPLALDTEMGRRSYAYFQHFEPMTLIGGSVWVFDISPDEADRVRVELGLAPLEGP